jgi:ketosteroid isomerase-like protein
MSLKYTEFAALDPFFEVVQRGLSDFVDGSHYFDTIATNAIFEFRYEIAGWPRRVEGRDALMALYRGYGDSIVLHGGDGLVVHRCDDGHVIVIEYEVHGRVISSGAAYENRFVSIVTVENRQIVHWRDYMDSLAAVRALSTKRGRLA